LWWRNGLADSERLTFRNEIVWAKPSGFGQNSELLRSFSPNTERALFFMLGEQGFNNNADNYWEGWENIRTYLNDEMEKCGGRANWKNALDNQMGSHYFTKSQWAFPTEEAYAKLQAFGKGNSFNRDYDSLKREFYATRSYFDNTHENMTEVWQAKRVSGKERHSHATPKRLELMQRVMKSSAPEQGLVFEPFGGSGSTLIGAEQTGRICYTMELTPAYVDVIIKRWENLTGKTAELVEE
jgi:DNA modification methylase